MTRKVFQLEYAAPCLRPSCIPQGRAKGTKAVGLRYERAVGEAVRSKPYIILGPWFEFRDANGWGCCQPDFIIERPERGDFVVMECKLTENEAAYKQLNGLYLPVVAMAYLGATCGAIVTRHLTRNTRPDRIFDSFDEMLAAASPPGIPIWHYLGRGSA